jgi:hypothetical protein
MSSNENEVLIVGAGVSGLLLAQHLRKRGISYQIFERDTDLTTRGLGWGLTLHWSLPALRQLLPEELLRRIPETYVDRTSVEEGRVSTFPFFDLSTGELKAATPTAPESQRIRIARDRFRQLIATGINIQVSCGAERLLSPGTDERSGQKQQPHSSPMTALSRCTSMMGLRPLVGFWLLATAETQGFDKRCFLSDRATRSRSVSWVSRPSSRPSRWSRYGGLIPSSSKERRRPTILIRSSAVST